MRAVALLGPIAQERHFRPFELPGVNLFSGNELDPTDRPDAALIFGGDGTIHRHIGGLALKDIPTLVVPMGSANDFARSIGLRTVDQALAAWKRFCESGDNLRSIDLGTIQSVEGTLVPGVLQPSSGAPGTPSSSSVPDDHSGGVNVQRGETISVGKRASRENPHFVPDGPRRDAAPMGASIMQSQLRRLLEAEREVAGVTFFASIAGTGLDAAVNRLTLEQPRWLRGHGGYVVALVQVLRGFKPPHITVSIEVDGQWQPRIDGPGFLIAAGNGPQYGHGMRLTHQAKMDDGMLDVCFVRPLSKLRLLRLFHVVYRGGHIGMKEVEYFRAARLRIGTQPVTEVFADGEYICQTPVELGVHRNALRVMVNE